MRRLILIFILCLTFSLPVLRAAQAACPPPGLNNTDNSITVSSGTCNGEVMGGNKTGSLPPSMTNDITNNGTVNNTAAGDTAIYGGDITAGGSGSLTNIIVNNGTVNGGSTPNIIIGPYGFGIIGGNNDSTVGSLTTLITNNGTIVAGTSATGIFAGDNNSDAGTVTVSIINDGLIDGTTNGGFSSGIFGANNGIGTGSPVTYNTLINNDEITAYRGIVGGDDSSVSGSVTNVITNNGAIIAISFGLEGGTTCCGTGSSDTNTITNNGTITAGQIGILGGLNFSSDGNVVNNIVNNSTITAGEQSIQGGDNGSDTGNIVNNIVNTGIINADQSYSIGIQGGANSSSTGNTLNVITNLGVINSTGNGIWAGDNFNLGGGGTLENIITNGGIVNGNVDLNGLLFANVTDDGTTTNTLTNTGLINGNVHGGNDFSISGSTTNTIDIIGVVNGNIIGGSNLYTGSTTNSTTLSGYNPVVTGTISGDGIAPGDGGALDQLFFEMQTTNESLYKQWQGEIAQFGGTLPSSGSIIWDGHLYKWQNLDELENLVKFFLIVTWFNPNDGRLDGRANDRIVLYCHADKDSLGVILVNNQSVGNVGTSFTISKLKALGTTGTSVDFGINGVLSIELQDNGFGYAAWNGGVDGATGHDDFAKSFICAPQ